MSKDEETEEQWNNKLMQEELLWRRDEEYWEYRKEMQERLKEKDGE